jgi:hypothetical protein
LWNNGTIEHIVDGEQPPGLTFLGWTGRFKLEKQSVVLENTRMISKSGVSEVSGDISFDRQWNLRFTRANGSGFAATGSMTSPVIVSEPANLAEARR